MHDRSALTSRWIHAALVIGLALLQPGDLASAAAPASDLGVLGDNGSGRAFAQVLEPREFEFPRDHGPHPEFRHEWWYVTGNLDGTTGERFGFELTLFRFGVVPASNASPAAAQSSGRSHWRTQELYLAHFAITDVARRRFRFAEKLSREALGLAGAQARPLRVWIDDWSLGVPARAQSGWKLHAAQNGYELSLDLQPLLPPILNGDRGLSRKSDDPGSASYYYSIPRVAVRGRLLRDGLPLEVQGLAWLDREWGSGALGRNEEGWDWFALQLEDGGTLMFYALRDRGGGRNPNSAGTWVEADGRPRVLASADLQVDVSDYWTNPRGERYPARWRLRAPSLGLDVDVHPVLADQELATSPRYWEGAVDVKGTHAGRAVAGRGYVELVGYAKIADNAGSR